MTGGDYLLPIPALRADVVNDPLFMYLPSEQITVTDGQALGAIHDPYFDRRPRHFSGHVNAPSQPDPNGFAAGVAKGGFTYLAHPIFSCYHQAGAVAMLEIAEKVVARALGRAKMIQTRQDLVTLKDIAVALAAHGSVVGVRTVPDLSPVPFVLEAGRLRFTVPQLRGHQMVEIMYEAGA
jgi:hypothetical protein